MEVFTSHGFMYTQAISKALEDRVPGGVGGGGLFGCGNLHLTWAHVYTGY